MCRAPPETSADTGYAAIVPAAKDADIADNDTPGVTVTESGTTDVVEGGATDTYDVVLDRQPRRFHVAVGARWGEGEEKGRKGGDGFALLRPRHPRDQVGHERAGFLAVRSLQVTGDPGGAHSLAQRPEPRSRSRRKPRANGRIGRVTGEAIQFSEQHLARVDPGGFELKRRQQRRGAPGRQACDEESQQNGELADPRPDGWKR